MPNTNADGIVTPDEEDLDQPDVYLAAMADSISNGIGTRLAAQEKQIGLKASLPPTFQLNAWPTPGPGILPFAIGADATATYPNTHNYIQGVGDFAGGIVTIQTQGIYNIFASVGVEKNAGRSVAIGVCVNGSVIASAENMASADFYASANVGVPALLMPNDTVYVLGHSAGGSTAQPIAGDNTKTYFAISLQTPIPTTS
jgi:hypothetical protein